MKLTDETKIFIGIIGATLVMIVIAVLIFTRPAAPPPKYSREQLIPAEANVTGNASASAYLVEFSDYQCPACKEFEPAVEQIVGKYKDKLQFAYRNFPLDQHPFAIPAAQAAEAAGVQGQFWQMHKLLFENQDKLADTLFPDLAKQLKLDAAKFDADFKSQAVRDKIDKDHSDGITLNIQSTPTFFLNGTQLTLNTPDDLAKAVEAAIK